MLRAWATLVYRLLRRTLQRSEIHLATVQIPFYLIGFSLLIFFSSCEKVIDIKLKEADKKIVIEGTVSYNSGEFPEVRISETKNFEDSNGFNGISGATVTIQVNDGMVYQLAETTKGIYQKAGFYGALGNTYHLTVLLNGNTYTAVSTMPSEVVSLDSLWAESLAFGGNSDITIYPKYTDPPGLGNSYRLVQYKNDTLVKHVFVQNDELSDGLTITRPMINPDSDLKEGDFVRVELQCIDANVYKYWYSLDQSATGSNQSAAPANPVTNIEGGALGYFSAYSSSYNSMIIP